MTQRDTKKSLTLNAKPAKVQTTQVAHDDNQDSRPFDEDAKSAKPPSLASGLALAHKRIELLRAVCVALLETSDGPARAKLLGLLAIHAAVIVDRTSEDPDA